MDDQVLEPTVSIASLFGTYQPILEQKIERQKHSRTEMQQAVTALANEFKMSKKSMDALFWKCNGSTHRLGLSFAEMDELAEQARQWKQPPDVQGRWLHNLVDLKLAELKARK